MQVSDGFVVAIGASAGGVEALLELGAWLPGRFAAPVCIVQHIGTHASLLPELLRARGRNRAVHPVDGDRLEPGTLYVAPSDHHMVVDGPVVRIHRGPKENHTRPAIDPLFRSVAATWGTRAIGVVLTGHLDDGTVGLKAIKECGGTAVVQDPATAAEPEMPANALRNVQVDHCVSLQEMPRLLQDLVGRAAALPLRVPAHIAREFAINQGDRSMDNLAAIAELSPLTCPDCGGGLWEMNDERPLRYRCHTAHAFTAATLEQAQLEGVETTFRSGVRALRERELLLRRLANVAQAAGDTAQAAAGHAQADRVRRRIDELLAAIEEEPAVPPHGPA